MLQAGIRLALILVIRLRHSAAGFIQGEQRENNSRSVPMPTRRSEHNAWMVDGLWNVDVGQFHDDDIGKGSDGIDRDGQFIVCASIFPLSLNAGGARPRLTF
jgi:hypothetical protein